MKRDLDLIRKLLEDFEKMPPGPFTSFPAPDGSTAVKPEILEHVALMCRAGLLEGVCEPTQNYLIIQRISWKGHDFLDATRNPTVWQKTKTHAQKAGAWTFDLILEIAKAELRKLVIPEG